MSSNVRSSNGTRYRSLRVQVRARGEGCWICRAFGRDPTIDYSLPAGDPRSFEVDHLVPVSRGGALYDPANCVAAHRACNQWRGNKTVEQVLALAELGRKPARIKAELTTDW